MGNKNSGNSNRIQGHTISIPIQEPIKPLFSHSIKWRCATPSDFAFINKLRPKFLSRINLSNNEAQNPGGKAIKTIRRALIDAKRLSNLQIEDSRLNSKQLHHILNSTNHLKKVKIHPTDSEFNSSNLSNSLARIGRNKDLSELTISPFDYEQVEKTYRIYKQLKHVRKLESLDLNNVILLSLQPLGFLKSVWISFGPNSLIKQSTRAHLLSNLHQCSRLEELTLNFQHSDSIDLQEAQLWTLFFQKTQSLKSLTLFRSFNANQDYSGFQVFPECFKFMKHLTTLRVYLNISADRLDHDPVFFIDFFFDSLKSLPQLKRLIFTIDGSYIVKDAHIKHLASALGCLENLHSLDLNILRFEFSSEVVISLAKNLKNLSCLKHFKLKFAGNKYSNLTYKAVKTFAKSLTHLPLKSLDLALTDQPMRFDYSMDRYKVPFLSALSNLKDLSSLHLDLSAFIYYEWEKFHLNPKILRKLTSLSLVLGGFSYANGYGAQSKFLFCLKVMPNLTTLKLSAVVLGQEIDLFLRNLDGCPNLNRLELTFKTADPLEEKDLDSLQLALMKFTKLEYLEVNLWKSQEFKSNVVNQFLCGLTVLKRLKELVANFERPLSFFPLLAWRESVQKLRNCRYLTKVEINCVRYL